MFFSALSFLFSVSALRHMDGNKVSFCLCAKRLTDLSAIMTRKCSGEVFLCSIWYPCYFSYIFASLPDGIAFCWITTCDEEELKEVQNFHDSI